METLHAAVERFSFLRDAIRLLSLGSSCSPSPIPYLISTGHVLVGSEDFVTLALGPGKGGQSLVASFLFQQIVLCPHL